jgi:hypothetical protein
LQNVAVNSAKPLTGRLERNFIHYVQYLNFLLLNVKILFCLSFYVLFFICELYYYSDLNLQLK